jgi:hypothetical protein
MINWDVIVMAHEHSKDLLREAEVERLVSQAGGDRPALLGRLWQSLHRGIGYVSEYIFRSLMSRLVYPCTGNR